MATSHLFGIRSSIRSDGVPQERDRPLLEERVRTSVLPLLAPESYCLVDYPGSYDLHICRKKGWYEWCSFPSPVARDDYVTRYFLSNPKLASPFTPFQFLQSAEDLFYRLHIHALLENQGDYWLEKRVILQVKHQNQEYYLKCDVLFFKQNTTFCSVPLPMESFSMWSKYHLDIVQSDRTLPFFTPLLEYPEALGRYIADRKGVDDTMLVYVSSTLFVNEYRFLEISSTGDIYYPHLSILISRKKVERRIHTFFQFFSQKPVVPAGLQSGLARHNKNLIDLTERIEALHPPPSRPIYACYFSPNKKQVHVITYALDGQISSQYCRTINLEITIAPFKETHQLLGTKETK